MRCRLLFFEIMDVKKGLRSHESVKTSSGSCRTRSTTDMILTDSNVIIRRSGQ